MFKKLLLNFTAHGKLIGDIRNDNYKNWESHFNNYNTTNTPKADPVKLQSLGLEIYESNLKAIIQDYAITDGEKEELTKIENYFQLSDTDINSIKSKYAKRALAELSKQKMADNQLTEEEIREIGLFAKELNIAEEEVKRINQQNASELYESAVKQIVSDNMVTLDEQRSLKQLAQQLGLNMREATIDKKLKEEYYFLTLLNALENGYLPEVKPPAIEIQGGEVAYWEISSNLVAARTVNAGYSNEGSNVRLKVEKGVSYRLGSSRSTPIIGEIHSNQQGVFVVTSQRVVFAASRQSFSIPFTQLYSFDTYADGIGLRKSNTELLLQFYDKQMSEVVFKVLTNAINGNI
jgi:hypothetical protein